MTAHSAKYSVKSFNKMVNKRDFLIIIVSTGSLLFYKYFRIHLWNGWPIHKCAMGGAGGRYFSLKSVFGLNAGRGFTHCIRVYFKVHSIAWVIELQTILDTLTHSHDGVLVAGIRKPD